MPKRLARFLLLAWLPLATSAQEAPQPAAASAEASALASAAMPGAATATRRHLGLFVRPELGFGYLATSGSLRGNEVKLSGGGLSLGLAIGGAVSEDFIIAGRIWQFSSSTPTVTVDAGSMGLGQDFDVKLGGVGVLLNWYLMPGNWYVAATPSVTWLKVGEGSSQGTYQWGLGLHAAFGKEWWVSDNWGLGLNATAALSGNEGSGTGQSTWGSAAFGLNLSATYD